MNPLISRLPVLLFAAVLPLACRRKEASGAPRPPAVEVNSGGVIPAVQEAGEADSPWGLAEKLPKDTEGFWAFYDLAGFVRNLLESSWFKQLERNQFFGPVVHSGGLWLQPKARAGELLALLRETAGKETLLVLPAGFTEQQAVWNRLWTTISGRLLYEAAGAFIVYTDKAGRQSSPAPSPPMNWLEVLEAAADLEVPPVMLAVKAGDHRKEMDALVSLAGLGFPRSALRGTWKTDTGEDFQFIRWGRSAAEISEKLAALQSVKLPVEFTGSEPRAKAAMAKLAAKSLEISWGWKGGYLVLAAGQDHRHVKFVPAGEGLMTLPVLASRIGAWRERRPFYLSYSSQSAEQEPEQRSLWLTLSELAAWAGGHSSIPMRPLASALEALHRRSAAVWPPDADAMVSAAWCENGLKGESIGGPRLKSHDASRPLTFPRMAGPSAFFLHAGRSDSSGRNKQFAFLEEAADRLWTCYQKSVRPGIRAPSGSGRIPPGLEALESRMVSGLRNFWSGLRTFREALGDESMFVVLLDGEQPAAMNPAAVNAPFPRALWVHELRDRAKLSEVSQSWTWIDSLASAIADSPATPRAVESKAGSLTVWGWLGSDQSRETWFHTAASDNRWYLSTSQSLTISVNASSSGPEGQPAASLTRVNFGALWDAIDRLEHSLKNKTAGLTELTGLLRAFQDFTLTTGKQDDATRRQWHLRLKKQE